MTALSRHRISVFALRASMVFLLMAPPLPASGQVVATTFADLPALLKTGDTIDVTGADGRRTTGRLGELSAASLEILVRRTQPDGRDIFVPKARLSEDDVRQVRLHRRDSVWNGTLIGFAPGAAIGVLMLFAGAGCDCYTIESRAPIALTTLAVAGGIGAAIGAAIDASIVERSTVYVRASARRPASLQASPLVTRSAAGVRMTVRF